VRQLLTAELLVLVNSVQPGSGPYPISAEMFPGEHQSVFPANPSILHPLRGFKRECKDIKMRPTISHIFQKINFIMAYSSDKTNTDQEVPTPIAQKDIEHGSMVSASYADAPNPNHVIVDHAIEAIGMGRYQWYLTISCGFGFVVDQVSKKPVDPLTCSLLAYDMNRCC